MATSQDVVEPTGAPLSPLPEQDPLTPAQWQTLLALADAVIPSIKPASAESLCERDVSVEGDRYEKACVALRREDMNRDLAETYLLEAASNSQAFKDGLRRLFALYMPQDARNQLLTVLNILNSYAGSLLLTGTTTPFAQQTVAAREAVLKSWASSSIPAFRTIKFKLTALIKQEWIKSSPSLGQILGYPRTPNNHKKGEGFDYRFLQFAPASEPEVIETDVVIVGSGCGGAVAAKTLAEAGHRVILVDKSYHWSPEYLPMTQADGGNHLFMNGGVIVTDDGSTSIVAGSTWGGGGTVNWSASLQTQGFVRKEWADMGLPFFTSAEFQDSLDRVCARMGVDTKHIEHNKTNQVLLEGARKLGWSHKVVPQNTGGKQHYCGYCTLGCGSCEKQGPVVSYIPDAVRAGAQLIEGFDAREVLFDNAKGFKIATGVRGTWTGRDMDGGVAGQPVASREIVIKAKRVIVSCGTLSSPLLLLRSGLKNWNIGRHLHLHPVSLVGAVYDKETRPWEGGILTSVVDEFQNLDGRGHGVKLEASCMMPSMFLPMLDWTGGLDFKLRAAKMRHMVSGISLARDRDTGCVYPDPIDGRTRVAYHPSSFDKANILEGVIALCKIQYAAGAREIFVAIAGTPIFVRSDDSISSTEGANNDPKFQAWLASIRKRGFPAADSMFAVAHQMGSCRMGVSPRTSVVDPKGKVWATEGLYVADASVFPSASGVNPMVTNMAIVDWMSRNIAKGLGREGVEEVAKL